MSILENEVDTIASRADEIYEQLEALTEQAKNKSKVQNIIPPVTTIPKFERVEGSIFNKLGQKNITDISTKEKSERVIPVYEASEYSAASEEGTILRYEDDVSYYSSYYEDEQKQSSNYEEDKNTSEYTDNTTEYGDSEASDITRKEGENDKRESEISIDQKRKEDEERDENIKEIINEILDKTLAEKEAADLKTSLKQNVELKIFQPLDDYTCDDVSIDEEEDACDILDNVSSDEAPDHTLRESKKAKRKSEKIPRTPFTHVWAFGFNVRVPILNLTYDHQTIISYASSHLVVLYDYMNHKMKFLQGHTNSVTSISSDESGEWMATADAGKDSSVIVWNVKRRIPIFTKFDRHNGYSTVQLSQCAKYLVTVSYDDQEINFLRWTSSEMTESGTIRMDKSFGKIKKVSFGSIYCKSTTFCLTADKQVCFITYIEDGVLEYDIPSLFKEMDQVGNFTSTIYVNHSCEAMTSTDKGYILLWRDEALTGSSDVCKKELINYYNLNPNSINALAVSESWLVTGDSEGMIAFYDEKLNLHYCAKDYKFGTIAWMDFSRRSRYQGGIHRKMVDINNNSISSNDWERVSSHPKSAFLEHFEANDCVIGTLEGHLFYLNPVSGSVKKLIHQFEGCVTAMDSSEVINLMCVGTSTSDLFMYDLKKKVLLQEIKLHSLRTRSEQLFNKALPISCLKFCKNGKYLCATQNDGSVWLLDPHTLKSYDCNIEGGLPFRMIEFSCKNNFLAIVDTSSCIWLYHITATPTLSIVGKCRRAHDTSIVTLMFDPHRESSRSVILYSVGKDKRFVKYEGVDGGNEFVMKKALDIRIEEFAMPFSALFHPILPDTVILMNSQFKYRILDLKSLAYVKTAQAPFNSAAPFTTLKELSNPNYIYYQSGKLAGIEKLPLDGNPYKTLSMIVSGNKLSFTAFSHKRKCLLTNAENDPCILMWKINLKIVDIMESVGGSDLEPYYSLIEGGKDGQEIKDIKDYFIYSQILHSGEGVTGNRDIKNGIKACEMIDIMRALGFFPSEYEIQNLYHEIGLFSGNPEDFFGTIDFSTFVKLYLNHRPLFGITAYILNKSFKTLCEYSEMTKEAFISTLLEMGDCWKKTELFRVLWNLSSTVQGDDKIDKKEEDYIRDILPPVVTFDYLFHELLGLTSDSEDLRLKQLSNISHRVPGKSFKKMVSFKIKRKK